VSWLNLSHNYLSSMLFVSQLSKLTGKIWSCHTIIVIIIDLMFVWSKMLFRNVLYLSLGFI